MKQFRPRTWATSGIVCLAISILAAASVSAAESIDVSDISALADDFERELNRLHDENGFPGATAAFVLPDGRARRVAVGLADVEKEIPMAVNSAMPSGSFGKSFVGAIILKMAEEGRLGLDDKIEKWLASDEWFHELPNSENITVRMLLNHSSGIGDDYISQPGIIEPFIASITDGLDISLTHEDMVRAVSGTEAFFPAGSGFAYSDSNYIIAGFLIERITGNSYYEELQRIFLDPLALNETVPSRRRVERLASGYEEEGALPAVFPLKLAEDGVLVYDPAIEWTGGGLVSNPIDLARWGRALYSGSAMSSNYMDEMIASANGDAEKLGYQYGIGIQIKNTPDGPVYYHGGYIFGYITGMYYYPQYDISVAIQINAKDLKYNDYVEALAEVIIERLTAQ